MRVRFAPVVSALFASAAALGQSPGISDFLTLNAYTTQNQLQPTCAPDGSGGFIAAWESFGQDGSGRGVYGRRFDTLGTPVGDEFRANAYTNVDQRLPQVATDSSGNFVVAWEGARDDDQNGVAFRLFDSSGTPLFAADQPAHAASLDSEMHGRVARNDDGFVVVWHHTAPIVGNELAGQRFDPDGKTVGGAFQVAAFTTGEIRSPAVAMDAAGNFVVTWVSFQDGDATGIRARAYGSTGAPITGEFDVNTITTGFQEQPSVAMDGLGGFVIAWDSGNALGYPIYARRYDSTATPVGDQVLIGRGNGVVLARREQGSYGAIWAPAGGLALIEAARFDDTLAPIGLPFALHDPDITQQAFARTVCANVGRQFVFAWQDFGSSGTVDIFARRGGFPDGAPFAVDARAGGSATGNLNGVLEVGERVHVDQAYQNLSGLPYTLAGTASNFTGPAGLSYMIHDPSADYGTLSASAPTQDGPAGSTASDCFTATGNCFEFELTGARTPGVHWDTTYDEALSEAVSTTRTLHVGESFTDVPPSNLFYRFIETLLHTGVTGGCGGSLYCPANPVTRAQMAVFLLKSKFGAAHVPPPATGTVFSDVPASNPFAPWIEELAGLGITGGCAPGMYCPNASVNRQQMAVFLLKTLEGSAHTPPAAAGIFQDVPLSNPFVAWVEELYNRQITGGCVLVPLQYCPANPVTRGQMSAFLTKTFLLALYGP
jgi:hypothetical protein